MEIEIFNQKLLEFLKRRDEKFLIENHIDVSSTWIEKWKKWACFTMDFLDEHKLNYCLIKASKSPFSRMGDVDILIEDNNEIDKAYDILKKNGFTFHHVPFNNKRKLTAISKNKDYEIDFYHDATWSELRYEETGRITKNSIKDNVHGVNAQIPKPEHQLHIIASHAYNHGRFYLIEIITATQIILQNKIDFNELFELSKKFHFQFATYVLIYYVNQFLKKLNFDEINLDLSELETKVNRKIIQKYIQKDFEKFPIYFSVQDLTLISLEKLFSKNLHNDASRIDELANFMKHNRVVEKPYEKITRTRKY